MTKTTIAALSVLLLPLVGCGGGNDLSQAEAQKAMVSVSTAMGTGMQEVQTAEQPDGSSQTTVSTSAPCLGGGSMSTNGSVTFDSVNLSSFAFDMDITLDACATGNIVANGGLSFAGSFDDTGFAFSMTGAFSFSGEISGSCNIDVSVEVDPDTGGMVMAGSMCGFDAKDFESMMTAP